MKSAYKIVMLVGVLFVVFGGFFLAAFSTFEEMSGFIFLPMIFIVIGLGSIGFCVKSSRKRKKIRERGERYAAKIYGYTEDTSVQVNGQFPVNVIVHFFDAHNKEREAILPTSFMRGSTQYPIGYTIDIFEYEGQYDYDEHSVRAERIFGEEELMDEKPLEPSLLDMAACTCPSCGAPFKAAKGYTGKCPYCGTYFDVE